MTVLLLWLIKKYIKHIQLIKKKIAFGKYDLSKTIMTDVEILFKDFFSIIYNIFAFE